MVSSDSEKAEYDNDVKHFEKTTTEDNDSDINALTPEEQKKVIRHIDRRLVLLLGFMYCVSLMDRTNTGAAVVAGMGVDLVFIQNRYSIIVLVFFITYVLLQPVATVVLRKIGPRLFLPTITLLWGATTIGMGFVPNWQTLAGLRVILGIFEAGFFPGCAYLLSCWYPRYELQKRNAVFYLIGSMASAFAGILAYGIMQMNTLGSGAGLGQHYGPTRANPNAPSGVLPGIAGWRWIFIIQGLITCLLALGSYFLIVDFPEKAAHTKFGLKFLTEREAAFVCARIEKDRHDVTPAPFNIGEYLKNCLDLKVWGFALLFGSSTTITYAIAYFLPIILREGMGFSVAAAQCLVAPPYVAAAIVMFAFAWLGDKYHTRGIFIIINGILACIGLPLLGFAKSNGARYFGVFLATIAANANIPCVLTFQANNIRGQWKRALCSATLVGFGGIGGIVGSTVFRSQDAPGYIPGIYCTIGAGILIILLTCALDYKFWRANKRADAGGKPIEGLVGFRYTL